VGNGINKIKKSIRKGSGNEKAISGSP